jgi:hypothetical protein
MFDYEVNNYIYTDATTNPSRLTWGIASLRQANEFYPGYIAERACREEQLDLAGLMTSPTQYIYMIFNENELKFDNVFADISTLRK